MMEGLTMKGQTMKLRNMSAYVTDEKNITIELANGEVLDLENALVLHSYSSRVAVLQDACLSAPSL
jgi:hypothetical protein